MKYVMTLAIALIVPFFMGLQSGAWNREWTGHYPIANVAYVAGYYVPFLVVAGLIIWSMRRDDRKRRAEAADVFD